MGDSGGEDAGVEGSDFVGDDACDDTSDGASDGIGNAGRIMTGVVNIAVIGELVSCWS